MGTSVSPRLQPLLPDLNDEQVAAVTADYNHHILVLAGAGCGKTTVLTRRISYLISNGFESSSLCALTFTRKAADEMAERVHSGINSDIGAPLIHTFHSFARTILLDTVDGMPNFHRIGYHTLPRLLEEPDRWRMLANLTNGEQRRHYNLDIASLDNLLARFEVFPECIKGITPEKYACIKSVYKKFTAEKKADGLWDFSDMLSGCLELFRENDAILNHYRAAFRAVLVDEFQDTNPLQIEIVKLLLGDTIKIFAVGDDDQAIYGFRGADIRPTLEFTSVFPGAQIVKLQINYRSSRAILDYANNIFRHKNAVYRKILEAGNRNISDTVKPEKKMFENSDMQLAWIEKTAEKISEGSGISIDKMVILCRTNESVSAVNELITQKHQKLSGIGVLTVHKSKGLEFPVVFLTDLEESIFPSYRLPRTKPIRSWMDFVQSLFKKRVSIDCDWDEELRLYYVAVTRAQRFLYLLSVKNKVMYNRSFRLEPSRFFKMI
jgi:DNA helicase II / ATP-dependent DNA helicase PcrA